MYRKNIEVITDSAYKKSKRAQIKDLLSITRMSSYKPTSRTTKEYGVIADNIINSYTNGDNVGFYENQEKSINISKSWDLYGRDNSTQIEPDDLGDLTKEELELNSDVAQEFNYVETIYKYTPLIQSPLHPLDFLQPSRINDYLVKEGHYLNYLQFG